MTIIAVNEQKKALEDVIKVIEAALPGEKVHGFQRPKEALEFLQQSSQEKIRFQCFGNFEVFCGENKLVFRRSKAKELLAYLVDKMGADCTMGELKTILWEGTLDSDSLSSNLRNVISDLRRTLAEVGAEDVIIKGRNIMALDCSKVECDYYDFLNGTSKVANEFLGEYMAQYSWAEVTTATLKSYERGE